MSVPNGAFTRTNAFGPGQSRNYPRFHIETVQDQLATERAGRPIFKDEERVEVIMPGNPLTRPVFKVTDEHRQTWPEEYERFKKGQEVAVNGTPLEEWPRLSRSQVMELKALGFLTIEQVANMDDLACQRIGMGGMGLRTLAKAFTDDAAAHALETRLLAESDRKDAQIAELTRKVEELSTLLNSVHSELQDKKNAQPALATHIPGMSDPIEQMKHNPEPSGASSLDALTAPRRGPGRPRKMEIA